MIYGERLREVREEKYLKQEDLSNLLKVTKEVYGTYEREFQIMPTKHLNTICNFFNISFDYAFTFTNIKQYDSFNKEINKIKSGQRLKEFRKDNKITQLKLAKILKIGQPTIANYENGTYLIATPFLYDLCKKYNMSADYLLGKIDNPKYLK